MLGIISIVTIIIGAGAFTASEAPKSHSILKDIEQRISHDGYKSESHYVTTSDGYILEINRIPFGRFEPQISLIPKPVVFLMHGMQNSGLSFIALGPRRAIAYNLADSGYDVWIGNARGVINSRNHVSLNPDNLRDRSDFFDYTFHDIGTKDLPAMIDYVLDYTKRRQLHYIGHSQGGTAFLVLNSMLPSYNRKITSAHLLAGVGYQSNFPNNIVKLKAQQTDSLYKFARAFGMFEIMRPKWIAPNPEDCVSGNNRFLCDLLAIKGFMGKLGTVWDLLGGASIKQYAHYGQNIRDRSFRQWNYGILRNLIEYKSPTPPAYNLRSITADVTFHYSLNDVVLNERDVINMALVMPNARVRRVLRRSFSHMDYISSIDSKILVTDYIIEQLKKYDR